MSTREYQRCEATGTWRDRSIDRSSSPPASISHTRTSPTHSGPSRPSVVSVGLERSALPCQAPVACIPAPFSKIPVFGMSSYPLPSLPRYVCLGLFTVHKDPIVPSIHPARWGLCAQFGVNSCFSVLSTKLVTDYPHPHPHPHPLQHRQLDLRGYCQRAERYVRGFRSFVRRRLSRSDGSVQASGPPPSPYTFFCLLLLRIYDCSFVLQSRIRTWRRLCWCSRSI